MFPIFYQYVAPMGQKTRCESERFCPEKVRPVGTGYVKLTPALTMSYLVPDGAIALFILTDFYQYLAPTGQKDKMRERNVLSRERPSREGRHIGRTNGDLQNVRAVRYGIWKNYRIGAKHIF